jgi:hypothetical protein
MRVKRKLDFEEVMTFLQKLYSWDGWNKSIIKTIKALIQPIACMLITMLLMANYLKCYNEVMSKQATTRNGICKDLSSYYPFNKDFEYSLEIDSHDLKQNQSILKK